MLLVLSQAACQHVAYLCNERAWRDTGLLEKDEPNELRMLFVGIVIGAATNPVMLNLSNTQVRALDMLLTDSDPREGKLPDGTPILDLVTAVWRARMEDARDGNGSAHKDRDTDTTGLTTVR